MEKELTEEEEKVKADSIWAEFCKDMPSVSKPNKTETNNETNSNTNSNKSLNSSNSEHNNKVLMTKTYEFAGESVTVTQESEDNNNQIKLNVNKGNEGIVNQSVKRSAGLGGILDKLKKPKINTLQKSVIDWNNYKREEGIEDELSKHSKSKDTFIERQAFLQRTDVRQFEIEKEIRAKNRTQRQLSKN